jgi:hypothetical protein
MKIATSSAVALILSAGLAGAAQAAQSEIDLSSLTNANIQTYSDGTNYPTAGSTVSIGAASFSVSSYLGGADTTGAIQITSPTDSFVIPVNEAGYSTVYVLVNSAYGEIGSTVGSLVSATRTVIRTRSLWKKGSTSAITIRNSTMSRPKSTARRLMSVAFGSTPMHTRFPIRS